MIGYTKEELREYLEDFDNGIDENIHDLTIHREQKKWFQHILDFLEGRETCPECGIVLTEDNTDYDPENPSLHSPFCYECEEKLSGN